MSKFVKIQTELHDLNLLKRALDDLRVQYEENAVYHHIFSGFKGTLPLVVRQQHVTFGFRSADNGPYEVVADDMQLRTVQPLLNQLHQRYALHKVLQETEAAGFSLVEQATGKDQVIRLTVRRWS